MSLSEGFDYEVEGPTLVPTPEQIEKYLEDLSKAKRPSRPAQETFTSQTTTTSRTTGWLKPVWPILISAMLSAFATGVVTVTSISRELAVEHASVSIVLADYGRRITDLEGKTVSRGESTEKDKRLEDALKNLQDQVIQTNNNVDEIRQLLYQRFSIKR